MGGVWSFDVGDGVKLIVRTDESASSVMRVAPPSSFYDATGNNPRRALRPLLETIAGIIREGFGQRFREAGPGWSPLAASTVRQKQAAGLPKRGKNGQVLRRLYQVGNVGPYSILIATGALRDSYRQKSAAGHVERINAERGTVEVGSSLIYARRMDEGFTNLFPSRRSGKPGKKPSVLSKVYGKAAGGTPARPVLLTEAEFVRIQAEIGAFMDVALAAD